MALETNFNVNPYYDDFDEDKKFLRMLFKPGYAVQARELTQLQTILQKQVDRFGQHIFKNGSRVLGCQTFIQDATYINLSSSYASTDIVANNFIGQTILSTDDSKRAEVLKVYEADLGTGDPITLMVKQIYGDPFTSTETIKTNETSPVFANTSGVGTGQVYSVNEGVFFYDGFFIKNSPQTIALSKYSNTSANVKVGFEIAESVISSSTDTSLLDPAQDASNYQAPGADRYKIDLVLSSRSIDSTDLERFIELARVEEALLTQDYKYPIYSVLEDQLARRTYDESGNYTVSPFKLTLETNSSNTAQTDVTLSPGKAYVYGYEFETIAPTVINIQKPREVANVTNKSISSDFGYFVYTKDHFGSFPVNTLQTIDIHCVSNASINLTSSDARTNTKIGTARVKTLGYESATDTSNSKTYIYRTYLFDVNVGSITGNVASATGTSLVIGNVAGGQIFSGVNDAYKGAKIRITTGPGTGETSKTITAFTASTQTLTLSSAFVTTPTTASRFSIDFEFNDAESFHVSSGTNCIAAANIDTRSKDLASTYQDVFISDTRQEPLIFDLGQNYVANNQTANGIDLSLTGYSYERPYTSITFVGNDTPLLSLATGESLSSASTTNAKLEEYKITVTSVGTSPYTIGQIVPADKFTVNPAGPTITVENANNMTANIVATIDVSSPSPKNKTKVTANAEVQIAGAQNIFGNSAVLVYESQGQTTIANTFVVKTPDVPQSLYVSDVIELISVFDFNGANVANSGYTDITERYTLDSGQRDSFYDHASIKLKPGFLPAAGPLAVRYNRYTSSGAGYFSVDSYVDYDTIPTYTSPVTGTEYDLRDHLDFRPVRKDATSTIAGAVEFDVDASVTGPKIPKNGDDIVLNYSYFMPRIDKIVLNKNRTFEVIQGISSLSPKEPKDKDNSMTLYLLYNPPYVKDIRDVSIQYINNKRFTMRDIGTLEKRIDNLEYYTSLSLLEQDTLNKQDLTILDSTNLPRFKNGIITDGFKGHSVADVNREEYQASIDVTNKNLRPSFNIYSYGLTFDSANSTNFLQTGPFVTATGSSVAFIDQPLSSRSINVNPFNVVNYLGKITLNPPSDIWVDTDTRPDVLVNLSGDQDAWNRLLQTSGASSWQFEWGAWQNRWTGEPTTRTTASVSSSDNWEGRALVRTTTTTTTNETNRQVGQTRDGIASRVVSERITQSIGDRIVDVSVIPFMRSIGVLFTASDFKPSTTLYPFFDNSPVEKYVARANRFTTTTNNIQLRTTIGNFETVTIRNASTSATLGTGIAVLSSNNNVYLTNITVSSPFNVTADIVGQSTGNSYRISSFDHYSGIVSAASSSSITLSTAVTGATNTGDYAGATVFITSGKGAGQSATVSSYNSGTRVLSITGTWSVTPDTTSTYSIGRLKTDQAGKCAGVFAIPSGTFRVGEKNFRLTDTSTGDIPSSSTSGDAAFFAQGLLQQKEEVLVSTIQPFIQRQSATDNRVITERLATSVSSSSTRQVVGWNDPLSQTFLVSPANFPQGVFVDKMRFCFKTKDDIIPITLQIRPTVNGYPSSSVVYPYATVSLTPDKVKITESPSLDDSSKYTDFVFDTPIYLQPGEHSFVLMANSNKYEAYIAEIGKLDLVGGKQISEQPYGGSLFLSQNGSTWTSDQNSDMMFRIFRKDFSTNTVTAKFKINTPSANTPIDLLHLITSEISVANTTIDYTFDSQKTSGAFANAKSIIPLTDYDCDDGEGRRILYQNVGNNTFVLTATMSTTSSDVSPVLDTTRFGIIAVENKINNLPLLNTGFVITSGGSGYSGNCSVTISGGGGSAANAFAVVANGNVTSIIVDSAGSAYTTSPTITITGAGTGATAIYNGEDKRSGGNSIVRYVTRKVTLADGFDSSDLRVYLTGYKPSGSEIHVYYKLLSKSDPNPFDNSQYQLMTRISGNFTSSSKSDFREMTYAPGVNGIANNSINYTTDSTAYNTFRTFVIKIVMVGNNSVDVPKIRDFRAIALPAG
jgi:hypothetical protein